MSLPRSGIYKNGVQQEVDPTSLPDADTLAKGAVKQGASEICFSEQNSKSEEIDGVFYPNFEKRHNDAIKSRRAAGQIQNTEFVVIFDLNAENADYDAPSDPRVFHAEDTTTLQMSGKYIPQKEGFVFKGWALTSDAVVPTYPYDESDPQDYTLTFVDDDITLYGVWEEKFVTITYYLGDYGQGSYPEEQTVREGAEVEISFSPAPTVNDGSGRVFVGWATDDGLDTYNGAEYKQDGMTSFTPYADVRLYPVFCAQYTLGYDLGKDGAGSFPNAVTGYNGESVPVSFSPAPTCLTDPSKSFLGWSENDEDSTAQFSPNDSYEIYMNRNVILYPVFGEESQESSYITIENDSSAIIDIIDYEGDPGYENIEPGDSPDFYFTDGLLYNVKTTSTNITVTFRGVYKRVDYSSGVSCEPYSLGGGTRYILPPTVSSDDYSAGDQYWEFYENDSGTLEIVDSQQENNGK